MAESLEDAFRKHGRAVNGGRVDEIITDYAEDAVILTDQGALHGRSGAADFFDRTFALLPQAHVSATRIIYGEQALLVWWTAESPAGTISDGVDTFVYADGLITLQTTSFTVQPAER